MPNRIATSRPTEIASAAALGMFLAAPPSLARSADGSAPAFIQIFPAGPELATNDGRRFRLSDPAGFVERFNAAAQPILVDYDHLSAFTVEDGGNSKAAGWISRLEVRDGAVWAAVEWTALAAAAIAAKEYRYISPEFQVDKTSGEVTGLSAVALVNRPAFQMTALARSGGNPGDDTMLKAIARALGLKDDDAEADIIAAIARKDNEHTAELAAAGVPQAAIAATPAPALCD